MGKIKGWKKKGEDAWTNGQYNIYIDSIEGSGLDIRRFPNIKYQVLLYPFDDSGEGEGVGSFPEEYLAKNKKEAMKIVMKFMRANPNG